MGRKWNNIKDGKAAKDGAKAKVYARFGKEIYMAAKPMPDLEMNQALRAVVDRARTNKVPREIIDRAIDKAKSNDDVNYNEIRYEGYGPQGTAIIVDCLTDNVNRTVAEVRSAFKKNSGNLGVSGSVAYMFDALGIIETKGIQEDDLLMILLEGDIDVKELETEQDMVIVYCQPDQLHQVETFLLSVDGLEIISSELTMEANIETSLEDAEALEQFTKLIETLEALDDVSSVYHNLV